MEISSSSNVVSISGDIKTISDFQAIKKTLDTMKLSHNSIEIVIKDSISITSSIIGYINKLALKDKIKINMKVGNEKLVELLVDLNLSSVFNVEKI